MMPEPSERYVYRIDASDRITFVSPEWLRFAEANEAPELTEANVVGKPIWCFITGTDSCNFYKVLYRNLRFRRSAITIPFRCDSPTVVRQMNLTLRPLPGEAIECEGVLLDAKIREPITILFRWAIRSDESIPICSLCRRLAVQDEWVELREAVVRKRLTNTAPVPRLEETVCPMCNCLTE
jgi:hypothetical protein